MWETSENNSGQVHEKKKGKVLKEVNVEDEECAA